MKPISHMQKTLSIEKIKKPGIAPGPYHPDTLIQIRLGYIINYAKTSQLCTDLPLRGPFLRISIPL